MSNYPAGVTDDHPHFNSDPDGTSEESHSGCKGEPCTKPHCPVCGECDQIQWVPCLECHGYGTIECICESVGGEYICGYGCDELDDADGANVNDWRYGG